MTFNCTSPLLPGVLVGGSWRKMSLPGAGWSPGGQSRRCLCSPTIGPTSALRGSTALQIDIFGTGLSTATGVDLGGGITLCTAAPCSPMSVTSSGGTDHLTAFINITNTAGLTTRHVRVVYPGGQTPVTAACLTNPSAAGCLTFTVLGPTLTGITPKQGTHGAGVTLGIPAVNVTITGTGVTGATGINFPPVVAGTLGGGITVGKIVVSNDGATLTATLTIANGAAQTLRDVWVVTPIELSLHSERRGGSNRSNSVPAGLPQWGFRPIRIMGIQ